MLLVKECKFCNIVFNTNDKRRKYCTRQCSNSDRRGINNPNFGNKWSDEQKKTQSILIKSKVDEDYREKAGSANRGKTFSKERIARMHKNRSKESYQHPHSDESKRKIGIKSKEKFQRPGFKEAYRQTMVDKGYWVAIDDKPAYEVYVKAAHWINSMVDTLSESDMQQLNKNGMFHNKKNTAGMVRDHKFSKKSGFENNVPPELLRHPANLEMLTHAKNSSKARTYVDSITLDELIYAIKHYPYEWEEQIECLKLIDDFLNKNERRDTK